MDKEGIIDFLQSYGVDVLDHSRRSLLTHLTGTCAFLEKWGYPEQVCVAGLCHSIYGTESYRKIPIELSERDKVRAVIGKEAEQLAYYFGALKKESFWKNLGKTGSFSIVDRFNEMETSLSHEEFENLMAVTLANWLEQRPQAGAEHQMLRREEFIAARPYLNASAYVDFCNAYSIKSEN